MCDGVDFKLLVSIQNNGSHYDWTFSYVAVLLFEFALPPFSFPDLSFPLPLVLCLLQNSYLCFCLFLSYACKSILYNEKIRGFVFFVLSYATTSNQTLFMVTGLLLFSLQRSFASLVRLFPIAFCCCCLFDFAIVNEFFLPRHLSLQDTA